MNYIVHNLLMVLPKCVNVKENLLGRFRFYDAKGKPLTEWLTVAEAEHKYERLK